MKSRRNSNNDEDDEDEFTYKHPNGKTSSIDWANRYCPCKQFSDRVNCKHIVAIAILKRVDMGLRWLIEIVSENSFDNDA